MILLVLTTAKAYSLALYLLDFMMLGVFKIRIMSEFLFFRMSQKRPSTGDCEVFEKRRKVDEIYEIESNSNDSVHLTCNGNVVASGEL